MECYECEGRGYVTTEHGDRDEATRAAEHRDREDSSPIYCETPDLLPVGRCDDDSDRGGATSVSRPSSYR